MTPAPIFRVNGSVLEVIRNGQVIERVPLGGGDVNVRVNGSAVEIAANGLLIERFRIEHGGAHRPAGTDLEMTEIPVGDSGAVDDADIMCY